MQPAVTDTDPEAARVHLALLRGASPGRRLWLAFSLSQSVIALSRRPRGRGLGATDAGREAALRFVELHYGSDLAARVRERLGVLRS